ncbi:MAG: TetR/AcrR family transcriptional regulator, partial [Acidobacteria bacterium]
MAEICRRAGVANGTFYQYFKDKEAVLLELATRLSKALRTELAVALQAEDDLEARLLAAFRIFVSFIRENRALYQIFREIEFVHKRTHNRFYEGLVKIFAHCFAEAYRHGEVRRVDFEVAAVATIGVLHFLVLRWLILGPGEVPEQA